MHRKLYCSELLVVMMHCWHAVCGMLPPWTFTGEVLRRQISRSIMQHLLTMLIDHFGISYRGR